MSKCSCTPRYDNKPIANGKVDTLQLVCSHGVSEPHEVAEILASLGIKLSETYATMNVVEMALNLWMREDPYGDHYKGFLVNWGTDNEWGLRMGEYGPELVWNRCPNSDDLLMDGLPAWGFHSWHNVQQWIIETIQAGFADAGIGVESIVPGFGIPGSGNVHLN
jgi:hypothetical protein